MYERKVTALFNEKLKANRPQVIDDEFKHRHEIRTQAETLEYLFKILRYSDPEEHCDKTLNQKIEMLPGNLKDLFEIMGSSCLGFLTDIDLNLQARYADLSYPRQTVFTIAQILTISFFNAMRGSKHRYASFYNIFNKEFYCCFPSLPLGNETVEGPCEKLNLEVLNFISLDESRVYFIEQFKTLRSEAAKLLRCQTALNRYKSKGRSLHDQKICDRGLCTLLNNASIKRGIVMADAPLTTAANMHLILKRGARYLLPVKPGLGHDDLIKNLSEAFAKPRFGKKDRGRRIKDLTEDPNRNCTLQMLDAQEVFTPEQLSRFPGLLSAVRYADTGADGCEPFEMFFLCSLMADENSEETLEQITAALLSRWNPGDLACNLCHDEEYDEDGYLEDWDLDEGDDPDLWEHFPLGLYTDSYAVDQAVDWSRRVLSRISGEKKTLSHEEAIKRMHLNFAENYIMFATYWLEGNDPGPRPEGYGGGDYEDYQYDEDDDDFFDPFVFFFRR